ncbi:chemotaxis protein CheX [bacterium]|nr:chemotaxis protein CheX [bacterium]
MTSDIRQVLLDVSTHVFETSAFMAVYPPEVTDPDGGFPRMAASIHFKGPAMGRLILAVSSEILSPLATSMLGLDITDEVGENGKKDALLEVLNMMCGNVLTEIHGSKPIFNLSPPELILWEEAQAALSAVPPENHLMFTVEDTRADLILQTESIEAVESTS